MPKVTRDVTLSGLGIHLKGHHRRKIEMVVVVVLESLMAERTTRLNETFSNSVVIFQNVTFLPQTLVDIIGAIPLIRMCIERN